MANKNKAKGTAAETRVVKFLKEYGIDANRKALTGNKDCGDIDVNLGIDSVYMLEVKSGKQTANPNRTQLDEWMNQTKVERLNTLEKYEHRIVLCALVIARHGRSVKDYDVWIPAINGMLHYYLDDFCDYIIKYLK